MSSQRYERVNAQDDDEPTITRDTTSAVPSSPPPSFRSRASSPSSRRLLADHDPLASDADRHLADTFDSPSDDDDDDDGHNEDSRRHGDARQRLMRGLSSDLVNNGGTQNTAVEVQRQPMPRRVTELPRFTNADGQTPATRVYGGGSMANDGVFANLSAKPTRGSTEDGEEKPPTYEQAAADSTPPYWETTILAPGMISDEVFIDGLPVGSAFSFVWNGMISMSFPIVGFLLTYLLHTTHAAKNGSRSGLGITIVNYGFTLKGTSSSDSAGGGSGGDVTGPPPDPNSHTFDPNLVAGGVDGSAGDGVQGLSSSDWFSYVLMIVGWFILIRAVTDFLRARRHEQLVLQSPDRGLGVAVVAEGEHPERSV